MEDTSKNPDCNHDGAAVEEGESSRNFAHSTGTTSTTSANEPVWVNKIVVSEGGRPNLTKGPLLFVGVHVLVVFMGLPLLALVQLFLRFIQSKGSAYSVTFQCAFAVTGFFLSIMGCTNIGMFPLVAAATGSNDDAQVGRIFRVGYLFTLVFGFLGGLLMILLRKQLFEVFGKESDHEVMLSIGESYMILNGVSFFLWLQASLFTSVFMGLGWVASTNVIGFLVFGGMCIYGVLMWDSHELDGFGHALIGGGSISVLLHFVWLRLRTTNLHVKACWAFSRDDLDVLKGIGAKLGWVTVRMVVLNEQRLTSMILATRLGMAQGAALNFLKLRGGIVFFPGVLFGFVFLPFLGSRLWGKYWRQLALSLFTCYFKWTAIIAVLATLLLLVQGKEALQEYLEGEVSELKYMQEDLVTDGAWIAFIVVGPIKAVVEICEGAGLAFQYQRTVGIITLTSMFPFLAIAILGRESFEGQLVAELVFFTSRVVMSLVCFLRFGWKPCKTWPKGQSLDDDWTKLFQEAEERSCAYIFKLRVYLSYLILIISTTFDSRRDRKSMGIDYEGTQWQVESERPRKIRSHMDHTATIFSEKKHGEIISGKREGSWLALADVPGYMLITDGNEIFLTPCEPFGNSINITEGVNIGNTVVSV